MNELSDFFLILLVLIMVFYSIVKKKGNKKLNGSLISLMLIIHFGQILLPRQILGRWNSISNLDGKKINKIVLSPSTPNWQVNLVVKDLTILEKQQLYTLIYMLRKVEVYFPQHPTRIWETKMTLYYSNSDSLDIEIDRTENNGTVISTSTDKWRKDEIGSYLEKLLHIKSLFTVTPQQYGISLTALNAITRLPTVALVLGRQFAEGYVCC